MLGCRVETRQCCGSLLCCRPPARGLHGRGRDGTRRVRFRSPRHHHRRRRPPRKGPRGGAPARSSPPPTSSSWRQRTRRTRTPGRSRRGRGPLDGTYLRILTIEDVDGLLPFRCLRCPPFFLNAGVSTIAFHRGSYLAEPPALGVQVARDVYGRTEPGHVLQRPVVSAGPGHHRGTSAVARSPSSRSPARASTRRRGPRTSLKSPWTKIKPCVYLIEHLWPGPIAC